MRVLGWIMCIYNERSLEAVSGNVEAAHHILKTKATGTVH